VRWRGWRVTTPPCSEVGQCCREGRGGGGVEGRFAFSYFADRDDLLIELITR
jgi:hypothetical protein